MDFYKIKLNGVIASELEAMFFGDDGLITLKQVKNELDSANGRDIDVDLSSVGGLVSVGTDIFFSFRDYKRANPQAQMILNIKSQAASMASFLAEGEFWDIVTVEDISSWMMHNPAMFVEGDYRVMNDSADYLERLSALYGETYSKRSKKSEKEIRKMMDKTTYLFGKEIVEAGFADEVLATTEDKNKDSAIAQMQLKYNSVMEKFQQVKMKNDDIKKAVASIANIEQQKMQQPATSGENIIQEDVKVKDITELKEKFPGIHDATMQAGEDKERARVKSLVEMKKRKDFESITPIMERIDEGIEKGETVESVFAGISALLMKNSVQASMESPGNINTGSAGTMSGETSSQFEDQGL
jgi:ATP-dependent protease ClpP protease subunit